MMRRDSMLKLIVWFLMIITFSSCDRIYYFYRSFIYGYLYHAPIKLEKDDNHKIWIDFIAAEENFISEYTDKEFYDRICEENNDMTYNQKRNIGHGDPLSTYPEITTINITCDKDYDKEHPAFTSLNDLIIFEYISYKKFITDGYKTYNSGYDYRRYKVSLDEEGTVDGLFMCAECGTSISFKYLPLDLSQDYNITVTMTYADGFQVSETIKYRFDS